MDDEEIEAWWEKREREVTHGLPAYQLDDVILERDGQRTLWPVNDDLSFATCPRCGSELKPSAKRCRHCGHCNGCPS